MEKSDDSHRILVFRTPSEKWKPECIAPKKSKRVSVIVWSCFRGGNHEAFCTFGVKSVNARLYLESLEYFILPVVRRVGDTIGDAVLQQGSAPAACCIGCY